MTLNSDELGEKGENRFKELCADARLICNKSDRDRTGWDYIIEFPFEDANEINSFDKRQSAISCHIQLKTMWDSSDRFKIRVSAAERLAKEPKPAFIYVLRVDKQLKFVDAYIFHIIGNTLSKILKRLRIEQENNNTAINQKFISFSIGKAKKLQPTGKILRSEITNTVGANLHKYIETKQKELSTLGYSERPHTLKFTIEATPYEDIVDGFLGLQDIKLTEFSASEERFGIILPSALKGPGGGVMSIAPTPADTCDLKFGKPGEKSYVVIPGEIYFTAIPNLDSKYFKCLIKTPFFNLTLQNELWTFSKLIELEDNLIFPLAEWIRLFSFFCLDDLEDSKCTIAPNKMPSIYGTFNMKVSEERKNYNKSVLMVLNSFKTILELLGLPEKGIGLKSILENEEQILTVKKMFQNENSFSFEFELDIKNHSKISGNNQILYVNIFQVEDYLIAYSAVADVSTSLKKEYVELKLINAVGHDLAVVQDMEQDYKRQVKQWEQQTNLNNVIQITPKLNNI